MRLSFLIISLLFTCTSLAQQWSQKDYENKFQSALDHYYAGQMLTAMKEAVEIENHASRDNSSYGFYVTYDIKGHLYTGSQEYSEAINYYLEALPFAYSVVDTIHVYICLIECCCLNNDIDKANKYLSDVSVVIGNMKKRNSKWNEDEGIVTQLFYFNVQRCKMYYQTNNERKFRNAFNQIKKHSFHNKGQEDCVRLVNIFRYVIVDKNYEKALKDCISFWPNSYYDIRASIYEKMGRYLEATNAWQDYYNYTDSLLSQGQQKDINEISEQIGNNKIIANNQNMSMSNTTLLLDIARLNLSKSKLAFERLRQNNLLHKAQMEQGKFQIEKRNAELAEIKARNSKQLFEQQARENTEQRNNLILISSVAVGLVLILLLLYAIHQYSKQNRMLGEKNQQLQDAMRQLDESEARKKTFFQQISHEVRTPLNAIMGFAQILALDDEELEKSVDMKTIIVNHIDIMKSLLKDVMGLSVLEKKSVDIPMEEVRIKEACLSEIDDIRSRCAEPVSLSFTSELGDDDSITTSKSIFCHILGNLLSNAAKNTTEGSITVNAYTEDDALCVSVTDTGCGIPEDMREAIFERFVKVDDFKQGFGLGLSLGRDYARLLGGDVILDTAYTGGARFIYKTATPCFHTTSRQHSNTTSHQHGLTATLFILLMALSSLSVSAQHNEYGVKEVLVSPCVQVESSKYSSNAFVYIDTLLMESKRHHDVVAQAFAYISYVDAKYIRHSADFEKYCALTQKFAREHHLPKYYYEAAFYEVKKLSRENKELAAFRKSNMYLQQALKEKYAYGRALMLRTFAESKYLHGEYSSAIPLFKDALKFELEHVKEPDMNPLNTYMQLGRSYLYSYKYPQAEQCLLEARKIAKTPAPRFEIRALLAQVAFLMGDKKKFFSYYSSMEDASHNPLLRASPSGRRARIDKLLMQNKTGEAYALCMAEKSERTRDAFLCDYYLYIKDYSNLLDVTKKVHDTYSPATSMERRKDIADFVSEQDNEILNMVANRLKYENDQLSLRSTNTELENTKLELARARAQELVQNTTYKNTQLQLKKRDTELRKIKIDNERKKQMEKEEKSRQKFVRTMLLILLHFFGFLLAILAFMFYRRHRATQLLKKKNAELTEAFLRKKEADAIKDKYIVATGQNLTEPLEALSAFSLRIASATEKLSFEEKQTLSEDIQKSSERIIELLDSQI